MTSVFEVAEVFVAESTAAFPGEIALIAYYGSHAKGTATETSDLDLFYIPDGKDTLAPLASVVVGGLPYDFWPVSWRMAEEIAAARGRRPWAVAASLVADARILFARSQQDRARFETLQGRIAELTEPDSRGTMVQRAIEAFPQALAALGQMRLALTAGDDPGFGWAGRKVIEACLNCLALTNQTYFSKGWGANFAEAEALQERPGALPASIERILRLETRSDALAAADGLVAAVRSILRVAQMRATAPATAIEVFRDFYSYVHEYVAKVAAACERGDVLGAGYAAALLEEQAAQLFHLLDRGYLPSEFNLVGEYRTAYLEAGLPDLHGAAATGDLASLAAAARKLDERMRAWLTGRGIDLCLLAGPEDLRSFLRDRYRSRTESI
jgi:hypothetical protein